jgi:hypothetical protein
MLSFRDRFAQQSNLHRISETRTSTSAPARPLVATNSVEIEFAGREDI